MKRPHILRRIENLRAVADDPSVNYFARAICSEASNYLAELAATDARMPVYGAGAKYLPAKGSGAIVCKKGGMGE